MPRKLFVLLSSAFFIGAAVLLAMKWRLYHQAPKNYEWNAVDAYLKREAGYDDLLLFEPSWLAGYAQDFGRLRPYSAVTRGEIFKNTYPPSSALWLVSMFKSSPLASRLKKSGFEEEVLQAMDPVFLTRYRIPSRNVLYDFSAHLSEAEVFVDHGDGDVRRAERQNGAWVFAGNPEDWNQVSVGTQPFRNQVRRCIWLHPVEDGVKTIRFAPVLIGKQIEYFAGIVDSGMSTPPGSPVYLSVELDGKPAGNFQFQDTDTDFYRVLDTASSSGAERIVTFQVQTANQARRHFCFSAWAVS